MSTKTVDVEFLESKEFKKLSDEFGYDEAKKFSERPDADLKGVIAHCAMEKASAKAEVESNTSYQAASADKKVFTDGLKELSKPLDIKSKAALKLLRGRGAK